MALEKLPAEIDAPLTRLECMVSLYCAVILTVSPQFTKKFVDTGPLLTNVFSVVGIALMLMLNVMDCDV
jgi:hypothetical protein